METLLKNKFVELNYDKAKKYLECIYFSETEDMTDEDYKEIFIKTNEINEKIEVERFFLDLRNLNFIVDPEMQEWIAKNSNMKIPENYKCATILGEDMITNLSIEQTVEEYENEDEKYKDVMQKSKYFASVEDAKKWLFE